MFDPTTLTDTELRGGRLAEVVHAALARGDEDFVTALAAVAGVGDEALDEFEERFGWRPPAELGEYVTAEAALAEVCLHREDFRLQKVGGWIFSIDFCDYRAEARAADATMFEWVERDPLLLAPMLLICGLVQFGVEPAGATCFVSALPHPDGSAEVWVFDDEVGRIDQHLGYSITDGLLTVWLEDEQEQAHFERAEQVLAPDWERGRPAYLIGENLYRRADWLIRLLSGHLGPDFASVLAEAPTFATWLAERDAARSHPHLAIYWMFAHYFFDNLAACREALAIVRQTGGTVGAMLADRLDLLLAEPGGGLGRLDADTLSEFRAVVYANADPSQLEPDDTGDRDAVAVLLASAPTAWQLIDGDLDGDPEDLALRAHREAIETLPQGDRRLAVVIEQLAESSHPDAHSVLVAGATRFLDELDQLRAVRSQPDKEWPTLQEMFRVDDYLIRALLHAMKPSDDEQKSADAQMLARRTLSRGDALGTLGLAWAAAMQVVAHYELDDLVYLAHGFLDAFRESGAPLRDDTIINLAESARSMALMDPARGNTILRSLFEASYEQPAVRADVIGAVLAGLLILEPDAEDVQQWTERILGNRKSPRPARLYGTLVSVGEEKITRARPWVRPHLWDGYSKISDSRSLVGTAALKAMLALGVPAAEIPEFEERHAHDLHDERELLRALCEPQHYAPEQVLERILELQLTSRAVVSGVADWLAESTRFSQDDPGGIAQRDRWAAVQILRAADASPFSPENEAKWKP